jgi:prolipoprotein diacylglyceryltransferase
MTMHRRTVPRTRLLAATGAVVALVGCVLPWWTVGGADGLPVRSGNAFDSYGILVFIAAMATLALVTLPYASVRPVSADRWPSYAIIAAVGWIGLGARVLDLLFARAFSFATPADAIARIPGVWIALIGLSMLARATFEMVREPRLR